MASQTNELAIGSGISNASTAANSVSEKEKTQLDEPLSLPAPTTPLAVVPATKNSRANDGENVTNHVYPKGLVLFLLMSSVFISMFLVALVCVFLFPFIHQHTRACRIPRHKLTKTRTTPFCSMIRTA